MSSGKVGRPFPDDVLMRDIDVARRFQVAPSTVRAWVSTGKFRSVKIGRCLRFESSYVEQRFQIAKSGGDFLERVRV